MQSVFVWLLCGGQSPYTCERHAVQSHCFDVLWRQLPEATTAQYLDPSPQRFTQRAASLTSQQVKSNHHGQVVRWERCRGQRLLS